MFNYKYFYIVVVAVMSCNNPTSSQKEYNNNSSENGINEKHKPSDFQDTTGFFSNCEELVSHSALGSLQGVEASSDSLQNLYFGECFDYCNETFEVIFIHKDTRKEQMKPIAL